LCPWYSSVDDVYSDDVLKRGVEIDGIQVGLWIDAAVPRVGVHDEEIYFLDTVVEQELDIVDGPHDADVTDRFEWCASRRSMWWRGSFFCRDSRVEG
jgi:hypothetical protein